jgi:uncharacterized protein YjbI with pentapeptide repeats
MANEEHVARLKNGAASWNTWRKENPDIRPDLSMGDLRGADLIKADLRGADLIKADLSGAHLFSEADFIGADLGGSNLSKANLKGADLRRADLGWANLSRADLGEAYLIEANLFDANLNGACLIKAQLDRARLSGANLSSANLSEAWLWEAQLSKANLTEANLSGATLSLARLGGADLTRANLSGATLIEAYLIGAHCIEANLMGADLRHASLVGTNFTDADLTGCRIHGVSAWNLKLERAKQRNLIITPEHEPEITADDIEVAQFIYLLLHNEKIRNIIDTVGRKAVLILGRFITDERKAILDALREELRKRNYLPILFDFEVPTTRDITETVSLLARMARFVVADLTDPSSIPKELEAIVPHLAVPVQPLLEGTSRPYAMFKDYWKYDWVLPVYRYQGLEELLAALAVRVIAPAEAKVKALEERRRMIEAELIKPR